MFNLIYCLVILYGDVGFKLNYKIQYPRNSGVELVQATDHASKMGYQLLFPLYCNQWGKARGSSEPILICCLPG